ncbi:hypothetical protein ACTXT7_004355 [Hymenolepis weldensis]
MVEKEINKHLRNTKSCSLMGAMARGMGDVNKDHLMKAFSQSLRTRTVWPPKQPQSSELDSNTELSKFQEFTQNYIQQRPYN